MQRRFFYGFIFVFAIAPLSLSQADVQHCRFISTPKERLACFDKETEPVQISGDRPATDPDKEKHESPSEILQRESDYLNSRMGTICRGC
jgi:hypothetical protein